MPILEVARECSALSDPSVLPLIGQVSTDKLPESYQSDAAYAVLNMVGRVIAEGFPPGSPWFQLVLPARVQNDPTIPPEQIHELNRWLMLMELIIQGTLETAGLKPEDQRRPGGFLSQKRKSITQLIVTGDTLERLDDDYRLRVFRRDQYITKRDSNGDVLYHVTKEMVDPLGLDSEVVSASGLDLHKLPDTPVMERMVPLYTNVEWQPVSKRWLIEQEVNGRVVNDSDESVSPYFATPFKLAPDEDYGRGMVELYLGCIRSLDTLHKRRLEILGIMSRVVPAIDHGSPTRERDLLQPSGKPIRARVRQGVIEDIAFLGYGNIAEHASLVQGIEDMSRKLALAFLVESASSRDAERVTAFERRRNAMEINGALGGMYTTIMDHQHLPLLRRCIQQLRRDRALPSIPSNMFEVRSLTGLNSVIRESKAAALLEFAQVASLLGPESAARIDTGVLLDTYLRYRSLYEPGLVKSEKKLAQERQQAINAQAQQEANTQMIETAGQLIQSGAVGA